MGNQGRSLKKVGRKKRLTIVIFQLSLGTGPQRVVTTMANYWAQAGWDITVLTLVGDDPPAYNLHDKVIHRPLGIVRESANPVFRPGNFRRLWRLRRALRESSPDAIISFFDKTNVTVLLCSLGLGVPVVVHEDVDPETWKIGVLWDQLRRWTYPLAAAVVVLSKAAKSYFDSNLRCRTLVIPNPAYVPPDPVTSSRRPKANKFLVAMGALKRIKGFDILLEAFALLKDQHPGWCLTILGEGPRRGDLERLIDSLDLSGRVNLPGWVGNPHTFLNQADVFVLSSRIEAFPMALTEAMVCGLPVIATECGSGIREIVRENLDGLIVPAEDVPSLAAAMNRLMSDEDIRRRMAGRASEVRERFGLEKVMGMWEGLLEETIRGETSPSARERDGRHGRPRGM